MKKPLATLYIIHGWTYTTAPWTETISLLEKKGLKVEMLNVPGLTSSSKKVWTIEDYVKWADRKIPDGAIALGHSNGGRILLNLCSQNPAKLSQLILLDAAGVYESSKKRNVARNLSKSLSFLKKIPGLTKVWHKLTGASDYAKAPANMKQTLSNMIDSDRNLNIDKVTTPTTILWGEQDNITPPRQAKVIHQLIPGSSLELFPDWNHAPYIAHPEELAEAIFQAIKRPLSNTQPVNPDNIAATSAALALKKAPEPVLATATPSTPVAPNVPTKLVLHKDDSTITKDLVITDEEGAAVKYRHKKSLVAKKVTNAQAISASANFKKAKSTKTPDLDAAATSASATLKKAARKNLTSSTKNSAALSLEKKSEKPIIINKLDQETTSLVDFVPLDTEADYGALPDGTITSASVPKVSRIEKAKRKVQSVRGKGASEISKKSNTKKNSANRPPKKGQA